MAGEAGVKPSKKVRTRVSKVEIVYENIDNPSDATVYHVVNPREFIALVRDSGIELHLQKMF